MNMSKGTRRKLLLGLIAAGILAAIFNFPLTGSQAILFESKYVQGSVPTDPDSLDWDKVSSLTVPLSGTAPVYFWGVANPPTPGSGVPEVEVRSIHNDDTISILLKWKDRTVNDKIDATNAFPDAVAVQFASGQNNLPSICMGQLGSIVNIWYWRADELDAQNLMAGGFGTITEVEAGGLYANSVREQGMWKAVFTRPLRTDGEGDIQFHQETLGFAIAAWDGANQERDGKKTSSTWLSMGLEGESPAVASTPEPTTEKTQAAVSTPTQAPTEAPTEVLAKVKTPSAAPTPVSTQAPTSTPVPISVTVEQNNSVVAVVLVVAVVAMGTSILALYRSRERI